MNVDRTAWNKSTLSDRFRELLLEHMVKQSSVDRPPGTEPGWIYDAGEDIRFAQSPHVVFDRALHVFTQEWVGIRAAAGAMPGSKLAISKNFSWTEIELRRAFECIHNRRIQVIISHGGCDPVFQFAEQVRKTMPEVTIVGVWHGSLANLNFMDEQALIIRFLELASNGVFKRISLMRKGMHLLHPSAVPYLTPNMLPKLETKRAIPALTREKLLCLFAGWTWKNMYSNLVAATASPRVGRVLSYNRASLPIPLSAKLDTLNYGTREHHFSVMAESDLVLNVTLVDCHPMIEMEALAVGTPVLRGQLDLDFGREHPFEKLMTVNSPLNPSAIKDRLEIVAGVPPAEMAAIVADYGRLVVETSFARYGEFLRSAR